MRWVSKKYFWGIEAPKRITIDLFNQKLKAAEYNLKLVRLWHKRNATGIPPLTHPSMADARLFGLAQGILLQNLKGFDELKKMGRGAGAAAAGLEAGKLG